MTNYIIPVNQNVANTIGLEPALVLQQIEYWIAKCGRTVQEESGSWIYNSLEEWNKQFSFWSLSKLRRIIKSLETQKLIISKKVNSKKWNQTKWYSINLDEYNKLFDNDISIENKRTNRFVQNEQMLLKKTKNNYTKKSSFREEQKNFRKINKKAVSQLDVMAGSELKSCKSESKPGKTAEPMVNIWNEIFDCSLKPIQAFLNNSTIFQLERILKTKFGNDLESWREYAQRVNSSKFLMGEKETKTNFKAEFLWLIKDSTIDSIQNGAYGVGDRVIDSEKVDENLKKCQKEVQQLFQEKVSKQIQEEIPSKTEEQAFKQYLLAHEYERDRDKYLVKKHMDSIGSQYMYGGYITPSHIFYPGNEKYKKRIFNSYLMKKYQGIDEMGISRSLERGSSTASSKGLLLNLKKIKEKLNFCASTERKNNYSPIRMLTNRIDTLDHALAY